MLLLYSKISKHSHQNIIDKYLNNFDKDFQKKILSYNRWQDAQLSLLGKVLLMKIFEEKGISDREVNNLLYSEFGKPYLKSKSAFFNISHSGEIVICAFSEASEIGIDIEHIENISIDDFKNQMTEYEWKNVSDSDNIPVAFYKYWTRKEAVIKAHGRGLSLPLNSFEIIDGETIIDEDHYFTLEIGVADTYSCHLGVKFNLINISNVTIKEVFM